MLAVIDVKPGIAEELHLLNLIIHVFAYVIMIRWSISLNLHEPFMLKWQKLWNTSHTLTLSCIKDFTLEQVINCCKKYGKLLWEDTYLGDNIKCICNRIDRYFILNDFNAFVIDVMMYKNSKELLQF